MPASARAPWTRRGRARLVARGVAAARAGTAADGLAVLAPLAASTDPEVRYVHLHLRVLDGDPAALAELAALRLPHEHGQAQVDAEVAWHLVEAALLAEPAGATRVPDDVAARAEQHAARAHAHFAALPDEAERRRHLVPLLDTMALLAVTRGDVPAARRLLAEADALGDRSASPTDALLALACGDLTGARTAARRLHGLESERLRAWLAPAVADTPPG